MRDIGIPKLLAWRWTPFAALVLGSLSFVGLITLVIPDQIGSAVGGAASNHLRLGDHFARTQPLGSPPSQPAFDSTPSDGATAPNPAPQPSPATQVANLAPPSYPKRGFSPPLERPEPPPPPPPPVIPPPVQQPVLANPPTQDAPPAPQAEPQVIAAQPDSAPAQQVDGPPGN